MTTNRPTPRTDAVMDWNKRCMALEDNAIITNGELLSLAHDESDELRLLARQLERELAEAREEGREAGMREAARLCTMTISEILLLAGEMNAGEKRAVKAVLDSRARAIISAIEAKK